MSKIKATVTKSRKKVIIGWITENPVDAAAHMIATSLTITVIMAPYLFEDWWGKNGDGARNTIFALAAIGAFYGLWVKIKQLKIETEKLDHGKQTQEWDGLSRASGQLGDKRSSVHRIAVRLLERMCKENPKNLNTVIEILQDFVKAKCRVHSDDPNWHLSSQYGPLLAKERNDVELVINTLGKIIPEERFRRISFRSCNFQNLNLIGVNFIKSTLIRVNVKEAHLTRADFRKAFLIGVHLNGARLSGAKLQQSDLRGLKFEKVDLSEALFDETDCSMCDFSKVDTFLDYSVPFRMGESMSRKLSLTQDQVNGMIYQEDVPPILPVGLVLPEDGAYREESYEGEEIRRRRVSSGRWIDDMMS